MSTEEKENTALADVEIEEKDDFDVSTFMAEDDEVKDESKEENSEDVVDKEEIEVKDGEIEKKDGDVEEVEEVEDDTSDWQEFEEEESDETEDAEVVNEIEETKESKEEPVADSNWEKLSEDLGIEAENYEDLVGKIKETLHAGKENEKVGFLKKCISLEDEELVKKELKARGYSEEEINEEIDDLIESVSIRKEARKIRKNLERAISTEKNNIIKSESDANAKQKVELEQARTGLKDYLSKTEKMFGGRVNKTQKDKHYRYITSGKFLDEILNNQENLAKSAWLWRYRDAIFSDNAKKSRTKGFEEGKKIILDNIQNPDTNRTTRIPEPESGDFNAGKFLNSESL